MDRYAILLGKKLEPQKGYWNTTDEHAWDYKNRLRLVVTSGMGGGKTSYLIYDAVKTSADGRFIYVCPQYTLVHVKGLLMHYASHFNHGSFDLCSWDDFWQRTQSVRGARTIYFDDAGEYDQSLMDPNENKPLRPQTGITSLMSYVQGRFANVPRIIITCDKTAIDPSAPIPKGNWDWKIEELRFFKEMRIPIHNLKGA